MSDFLSAAWFDELSTALASGPAHAGVPAQVDVVVKGGPAKITYHALVEPGSPVRYAEGKAPEAGVVIDQSWDDAVAQARGEYDPKVGFMSGQLKVKGSARPLLELFRYQADDAYRQALASVVATTTFPDPTD